MVQKIKISEKVQAPFTFMPSTWDDELTIMWNVGQLTRVKFDTEEIEIGYNCILFVSEFYMKLTANSGEFRIIKFNKTFINPIDSQTNTGEYLLIFYGLHAVNHLPKITLNENDLNIFEQIWQDLLSEEKNISNPISEALVRNSFQRFLLISKKSMPKRNLISQLILRI